MSNTPVVLDPAERLRRQQAAMNPELVCPCGSRWFFVARFERYSNGRFASAPGGDIQSISAMPQDLRVCLCGRPMMPNLSNFTGRGKTASGEMNSLLQDLKSSVELIDKLRTGSNASQAIQDLAAQVVSQAALDNFRAELEAKFAAELEKLRAELVAAVGRTSTVKAATKKDAKAKADQADERSDTPQA